MEYWNVSAGTRCRNGCTHECQNSLEWLEIACFPNVYFYGDFMPVECQIIEILHSDMIGNMNLDPKPNYMVWDHLQVLWDVGTEGPHSQSKNRRRGKQLGRRAEARFPWAGLKIQLRVTGEVVRVSCWAGGHFHMMWLCKTCERCSVLELQPSTGGTGKLSSISEWISGSEISNITKCFWFRD